MSTVTWNPQMTLIEDTKKYIVALNENYFKMPREYYVYLQEIIGKVEFDGILAYFAKEDQSTVRKIVNKLRQMGILIEENKGKVVQIQEVTLLLTEKCNFSCLHCCQDAKCGGVNQLELTYEEICKVVDKIEELKVPYIMLSGGEPMLRKDFFDIVTYNCWLSNLAMGRIRIWNRAYTQYVRQQPDGISNLVQILPDLPDGSFHIRV